MILVLGAGYAGLAAAVQLAARRVPVTLVNTQDRFTERLRLPLTATGQQVADLRIPDLLAATSASFVPGRVTALDPKAHTVRVDDEHTLHYSTLVYALGSVADTADPHAYTLNSATDAARLARRLTGLDRGTVVVVGSGLTGVESAAEIAERFPALTVVLAGRTEPGAGLHPRARKHLLAALDRLGVRLRGGVTGLHPGRVDFADGTSLDADAVLWTGGTRVAPLAADAGLAVDGNGRIVTDGTLRSVSHPDVYAVGDAAAIRQPYGLMHGTCQGGMPTGVHAALSICGGPRPFRFGYYHTPISLGRHDAVVQFTRPDDSPRRIVLTGRLAVRYKEAVTAAPWPAYRRMLRLPASGAWWPRGGRFTRAAAR